MPLNPTLLLAIVANLFVVPAILVLTVSFLQQQQGGLTPSALSSSAQSAIAIAGVAALVIPLGFPRLLRRSARSIQLLQSVTGSIAGAVFGLVLTYTSGDMRPIWAFAIGSMLAILGWTWAYRSCFNSDLAFQPLTQYTVILVAIGLVCLLEAGVRITFWDRGTETSGGPVSNGFNLFLNAAFGGASLAVAHLRRRGSGFARSATQIVSWGLLMVVPLGSVAAIYWLLAVRKREFGSSRSPHAA